MFSNSKKLAKMQDEFIYQLKDEYEIEQISIRFPEGVAVVDALKMKGFAANSVLLMKAILRDGDIAGYDVLQIQRCRGTKVEDILKTLLRGVFAIKQTIRDFESSGCHLTDFSTRYLQSYVAYKTNAEGVVNRAIFTAKEPKKSIKGGGVATTKRPNLKKVGVAFSDKELIALKMAINNEDKKAFDDILNKKIVDIKLRLTLSDTIDKWFVRSFFLTDAKKEQKTIVGVDGVKKSEAI